MRDFDAALQRVRGHCEVAALTRSERGSVVVAGDEVHVVAAHPVDDGGRHDRRRRSLRGRLHVRAEPRPAASPTCGRLGALAAAEVISHVGARPMTPLAALAGPLLG